MDLSDPGEGQEPEFLCTVKNIRVPLNKYDFKSS